MSVVSTSTIISGHLNNNFNVVQRRHHCRQCGKVVCGSCSNHKLVIPSISSKSVRVCSICYREVNESRHNTASSVRVLQQESDEVSYLSSPSSTKSNMELSSLSDKKNLFPSKLLPQAAPKLSPIIVKTSNDNIPPTSPTSSSSMSISKSDELQLDNSSNLSQNENVHPVKMSPNRFANCPI